MSVSLLLDKFVYEIGRRTVRMSASSRKFFWEPAKRHSRLRMRAAKAHTVGTMPGRARMAGTGA